MRRHLRRNELDTFLTLRKVERWETPTCTALTIREKQGRKAGASGGHASADDCRISNVSAREEVRSTLRLCRWSHGHRFPLLSTPLVGQGTQRTAAGDQACSRPTSGPHVSLKSVEMFPRPVSTASISTEETLTAGCPTKSREKLWVLVVLVTQTIITLPPFGKTLIIGSGEHVHGGWPAGHPGVQRPLTAHASASRLPLSGPIHISGALRGPCRSWSLMSHD